MPKRFILILLFLLPFFETILIFTAVESSWAEAFAQVVIKDEITLSDSFEKLENTYNPITVKSPFYGRIYFRKECMYNWISTVKGEIIAGGEALLFGNYNCDCEGSGSCWGCIGYWFHNFYNMPMGTEVTVIVQYCYNYQWIEVPLQFVYAGNNRYDLYGMNPVSGTQWEFMGYVTFLPTTPPGCANAQNQYCSEHGFQVPNVKSKPVEWSNGDPEFCDDYPGTLYRKLIPMAFTNFKKEWLENFNVFACFDKERQKWQFLLDNNNTLNINNSVKICDYNLRRILELKVVDSLDQVPNSYPCDKLIADLKRFKSYGDTKPGSYVFRKLMYQHEMLHINQFQEKLETMKELVYNTKFKDLVDIFECEDFDNPEEAAEEIKEIIEDEWINNLKNQAWGAMPVVAFQLLEDIDNDNKRWLVHKAESLLHQKMYDIINAWIAEAEKCLERN